MNKTRRTLYQDLDSTETSEITTVYRTAHQILREDRKNLHYIKFTNEYVRLSGAAGTPRQCLLQWLKDNLPDTKIEPMESEYRRNCDMMRGAIRIDFDEASLATFCATWEEPDGKSRDAHFQRYTQTFEEWRAYMAYCMPSFEQPEPIKACYFWDTPKGFLHYASPDQGDDDDPFRYIMVWTDPYDVWFQAGELVPEWRDTDIAYFVGGCIGYDTDTQQWSVATEYLNLTDRDLLKRNYDYGQNPENQRRICEWFGLVPERVVFVE